MMILRLHVSLCIWEKKPKLSWQNGVKPIPVQPADTQTYIPTAVEMEEAALAAEKKGVNPRVLLVTNPGNPLGTLYPESTLKVSFSS